ncbi:MAG: DNA mismatch repair protein MutS, partial [Candidatus Aminicenantes bacterium]|nr:DNA mismatch repair protein MutS [Candidatus Aminicenantes bacterium]
MSPKNSTTPMIEQYLRIKKEHQDSLLFFRLGDFYEMFYEDAKVASPVLEIALTSRQKVPMCGVPHHAVEVYLTKLLRHGFKVAICEQVEDPKKAKGVVKRDVVKILTPGTAIELEREEEKESTFVASLCFEDEMWGIALIDLASGLIKTAQSERESPLNLADELYKIAPKEVIFPSSQEQRVERVLGRDSVPALSKSPQEDWVFDFVQAKTLLLDHFQVKSLKGFGLSDKSYAVSAAGALLHYLKKLRKDSLSLIHTISFIQTGEHLVLDTATIKNLELVKNLRDGRRTDSLLDVIDFTVTSMGGRLLKSWMLQPLRNCIEIDKRLDAVAEFIDKTIERTELREALKEIYDLERLTGKISLAVANARDLVSLKKSLHSLPRIGNLLQSFSSPKIGEVRENWDNAEDMVGLVENAVLEDPAFLLTEGGIIKE